MAYAAQRAGMTDTVVLAEGKARGWKVVGMMFIAQGLAPDASKNTERTFDNLVQIKLEELKARSELDVAAYTAALPGEMKRECEPLAPMQEKIIELLRRNGL